MTHFNGMRPDVGIRRSSDIIVNNPKSIICYAVFSSSIIVMNIMPFAQSFVEHVNGM